MTWRTLNDVVCGLHTAMPSLGRDYTFIFQMQNIEENLPWARGELRKVSRFDSLPNVNRTDNGMVPNVLERLGTATDLHKQFAKQATAKRRRSSGREGPFRNTKPDAARLLELRRLCTHRHQYSRSL